MILPGNNYAQASAEEITSKDIKKLYQSADDLKVLAIVVQDIQLAEQRDHEWAKICNWDKNQQLYLFQVPAQNWEGTQVERSSMGVPLVLEHVNAINNQITEVLFEEDPPFALITHGNATEMELRAHERLLSALLDKAEAEQNIEKINFSGLLHGTGIGKAYWENKNGYMCPVIERIERRHCYVSANTRENDIRKANWRAHRMWYTPNQINRWRDLPGFRNIPPIDVLRSLGDNPQQPNFGATNDRFTSMQALTPEFDSPDPTRRESVDPSHYPLEVIEYDNGEFIFTILCRELVIRIQDNSRQHAVRYMSTHLIPVEGQFDGIGLGVLLGNEQRLQQGLINTSLDNLALSLLGMFKRKKGNSIFPNQIAVRPGVVFDVNEMEDLEPVKFTPIDPAAFDQLQMSDSRSQRRSGANEVTVQGVFPQTSGGIGRTAEGMGALAQASSARIRKYVQITEKQVLIPFLEFLVETAQNYLTKKQIKELIGPELYKYWNPVSFSKLKFRILAASKLKRRAAMIQAMPSLISFFQQEPIQEALKSQYMKLDMNEMCWMWTDATGYPVKSNLIVDMEQDEIEQMMSENEMIQQLVVDKARIAQETDAKIKVVDAENAGRSFRDIIKAAMDQKAIDEEQYNQLLSMYGQAMANRELDRQMESMNAIGQPQPDAGAPQGVAGSKGLGISAY